jgi:hypothetical protein
LYNKYGDKLGNPDSGEAQQLFAKAKINNGAFIQWDDGSSAKVSPWTAYRSYSTEAKNKNRISSSVANNLSVTGFTFNGEQSANPQSDFDYWYKNSFLVRGFKMGGIPNSGEMFVARENGTPEFVGSFGGRTAVANNDQIVTAVANGVSMANDRMVNAIQSQTESLTNAIDRKNLDVQIGDRQIAEANNRGQKGLGNKFVD